MLNSWMQRTSRWPLRPLSSNGLWVVCIVLGVLCLLVGVRLAVLLFAEPTQPQIVFPPVIASVQRNDIALYPVSATPVAAGGELAEASFNARLLGVIHLADRSLASIATRGNKEKIYRVGDSLAPGVTLERIETTRVVVRERGGLKQISLASLIDGKTPIQLEKNGG